MRHLSAMRQLAGRERPGHAAVILAYSYMRVSALAPDGPPQRYQLGSARPAIDLLLRLSIPVQDCKYERFDFRRRNIRLDRPGQSAEAILSRCMSATCFRVRGEPGSIGRGRPWTGIKSWAGGTRNDPSHHGTRRKDERPWKQPISVADSISDNDRIELLSGVFGHPQPDADRHYDHEGGDAQERQRERPCRLLQSDCDEGPQDGRPQDQTAAGGRLRAPAVTLNLRPASC
jgi:hypothetical protein